MHATDGQRDGKGAHLQDIIPGGQVRYLDQVDYNHLKTRRTESCVCEYAQPDQPDQQVWS